MSAAECDIDSEQLAELVRIGQAFKDQQCGRRPGFLHEFVFQLIERIEKPLTFAKLLDELQLEATRREMYGEEDRPIEKVNRVWEIVTYHHPRKGRQQVTFKTLRNKFTTCKNRIFPIKPKPGI